MAVDRDAREEKFAEVFGECLNRIAAGEILDPEEIRKAHPELAPDLLREIGTLQRFGSALRGEGPPVAFGNYRLHRQVGRGGMGIVYEAWQVSLERRVALKFLPAGVLADSKLVSRFLNEARTAARLQHPNIVSIYEMGVEEGVPFFAMEYVEGETLAQLLGKAATSTVAAPRLEGLAESTMVPGGIRPPEEPSGNAPGPRQAGAVLGMDEIGPVYCHELAKVFADTADGLQHAHERKIIHRDIKPSNLILDRAGRLRILDFGLARLEGEESLTRSGEFLGTPLYMSPEQASARRTPAVDSKTDIYSLGVTLYECLALRPPFRGKYHQDTLSQILNREPPPLRKSNPRIPRDIETIVLKCLEKDPLRRYGTAEALAQDLRRFARGDPIEARPLSGSEKLLRAASRRKRSLAAIAAAVLVVLLLALLARSHSIETGRRRTADYEKTVRRAVVLLHHGQVRAPGRAEGSPGGRIKVEMPERGGVAYALELEGPSGSGPDPALEALDLLEGAARMIPGRPDAFFHWARGLEGMGRGEDARRIIAPLLSRSPPFLPARIWRAARLERRGEARKPGEVLAGFRASGSAWGGGWEEAYLLAQEAEARRDWARAAEAYTVLLGRISSEEEPYLGAVLDARLGRGNAWLRLEKYDLALEDLGAAQALAPEAIEPYLLLGKTYYLKGDPETAEARLRSLFDATALKDEAARRIASLHEAFGSHEKALLWADSIGDEGLREEARARSLAWTGKLDGALAAAARAVELRPQDAWVRHTLGIIRFDRREWEAAVRAFEEAIGIDPGQATFYVSLGKVYIRVLPIDDSRLEKALALFRKAIEIDPASDSAHSSLGSTLSSRRKHDVEAEASLREALALNPRSAGARNALGILYLRQGKRKEAMAELREAIRLDPRAAGPHTNLGWALAEENQLEEGRAECLKSLELDPRSSEPHKILGWIYLRQGRLEDAETEGRKFIEREPDVGLGHFNLGVCLERQKRPEEAVEAYRKACELSPDEVRFPYNMGNTLAGLGRLEEAIEAYKKALAAKPAHGWTHNNLAEVYAKAGKPEEAKAHFRLAIRYDPESPDAHWGLAGVLREEGKIGEALEEMRAGCALDPKDPRPLDLLAMLEEEAGSIDGALEARQTQAALLEAILEKRPGSGEARRGLIACLEHRSRLARAAGMTEEAWESAARAADLLQEELGDPVVTAGDLKELALSLLPEDGAVAGDGKLALLVVLRAAEMSGSTDPTVLHALARAHRACGDLAAAVEVEEKALALLPATDAGVEAATLRKEIEARLEAFHREREERTRERSPSGKPPDTTGRY
jgi:serine/threonine protein kinase/tetratricopeptide (TPR) repeat protein